MMNRFPCCRTLLLTAVFCIVGQGLRADELKAWVESFNADDVERYAEIPNRDALAFLKANIPRFECPDRELERTYYFRWWTYRKHVRKTPEGYVVTEFLPDVPWARKHNTICCPGGHHFYEGRWLHDGKILDDYARFYFGGGGNPRQYSFWAADAVLNYCRVRGDYRLAIDLLDELVANYEGWEKDRLCDDGLFWQIDDRDGMEVSIGGSGKRATINSYQYGDAVAIAAIARLAGKSAIAQQYTAKAERLRSLVNDKLWCGPTSFTRPSPMRRRAETCIWASGAVPMKTGLGSTCASCMATRRGISTCRCRAADARWLGSNCSIPRVSGPHSVRPLPSSVTPVSRLPTRVTSASGTARVGRSRRVSL